MCEHKNRTFKDVWMNPSVEPPFFYLVKEYYCQDCRETFTIPELEEFMTKPEKEESI